MPSPPPNNNELHTPSFFVIPSSTFRNSHLTLISLEIESFPLDPPRCNNHNLDGITSINITFPRGQECILDNFNNLLGGRGRLRPDGVTEYKPHPGMTLEFIYDNTGGVGRVSNRIKKPPRMIKSPPGG